MPRRRRARRGRRRGRRNSAFQFSQRINAVIKGTIKYAENVSLNLKDFTDLKDVGTCKPVRLELHFASMNAPTYVATVQWDGESDNSYLRITNHLIQKTRVHRVSYTWPNEVFLYTSSLSTQVLLQIYHAAGGDVYEDEKPLLFYMAKLSVVRSTDLMGLGVDPPHMSTKHSTAPAPSFSCPLPSPSDHDSAYSMIDPEEM